MEGARPSWKDFMRRDLTKGGGSLHAVIKRIEEHQGESVGVGTKRAG